MRLQLILVDLGHGEIILHLADLLKNILVLGVSDSRKNGVVHHLHQDAVLSKQLALLKSQDDNSRMREGHDLWLYKIFYDFLHHDKLFHHHPIDRSLELIGLGADEAHHAVYVMKSILTVGAHLVGGELVTGKVLL